jgi:2-C-methyl-D-erythritol 4-phosphate cytidylyltransferase
VKIVAVVTADSRGAGEVSALSLVHGETLLTHAVRGLADSGYVDLVVVLTPAWRVVVSREALLFQGQRSLPAPPSKVVPAESIHQTLEVLRQTEADVFLVHDASRAFTPPRVVRSVVDAVRGGARVVVPVLPMSDTVKLVDETGVILGTQDRELLRTAQTPLGFTSDAFFTALAAGETDLLAAAGEPVHTVEGHPNAMRIATAFDLTLAEAVLAADRHEETL